MMAGDATPARPGRSGAASVPGAVKLSGMYIPRSCEEYEAGRARPMAGAGRG